MTKTPVVADIGCFGTTAKNYILRLLPPFWCQGTPKEIEHTLATFVKNGLLRLQKAGVSALRDATGPKLGPLDLHSSFGHSRLAGVSPKVAGRTE